MSERTVIRLTIEVDEAQTMTFGLPAVLDGLRIEGDGTVTANGWGDLSLSPRPVRGSWERVTRNRPTTDA